MCYDFKGLFSSMNCFFYWSGGGSGARLKSKKAKYSALKLEMIVAIPSAFESIIPWIDLLFDRVMKKPRHSSRRKASNNTGIAGKAVEEQTHLEEQWKSTHIRDSTGRAGKAEVLLFFP